MGLFGHFYVLLFALVVLAVVIAAGVWVVLWSFRVSPRTFRPDNALAILKERFARGEIDQQEYETRKKALLGP